MKWNPAAALAIGAIVVPVSAHAKIYASVEQAQKDLFGAKTMTLRPVLLTDAQQSAMRDASSVSFAFKGNRIWKVDGGGWFIVDEVVGKHETITYAVGVNADGTVRGVEILEYLESYGYEVADEKWRHQFVGKTAASPLKLGKDIENIGGATLSCKHIADGVKRVMVMVDLALKSAPSA